MRKNKKTIESEHYLLTLRTKAAVESYKTLLIKVYRDGIPLEQRGFDEDTWSAVTDEYIYPKTIEYRVAPVSYTIS